MEYDCNDGGIVYDEFGVALALSYSSRWHLSCRCVKTNDVSFAKKYAAYG